MNNHKLTDTGEYLVSEVEGEPTCLFSYGFYRNLNRKDLTYSENTPRIEPSKLLMNLIGRI